MLELLIAVALLAPDAEPTAPEPVPNVVEMIEERSPDVESLDPMEEHVIILETARKAEEQKEEEARAAEAEQRAAEEAAAAERERAEAARLEEEARDTEVQAAYEEAAPAPTTGVPWDDIARCESGYGGEPNWSLNTGNGFYGGLQFEKESWDWAGGDQYADMPHHATREQQIAVAEQLLSIHPAGIGAWPACADKLGLR